VTFAAIGVMHERIACSDGGIIPRRRSKRLMAAYRYR
jgi:hypothetical protein